MEAKEIPVGIVGLGLMGTSIATCLLLSGHPVVGVSPVPADLMEAEKRILSQLSDARDQHMTAAPAGACLQRLVLTEDYDRLKHCHLVIESTLEDPAVKKEVLAKIEAVIAPDALLTSNTSAIPISLLQQLTRHPERFLGLHWMEPAYTTRFLEVICGAESDLKRAEFLCALSRGWGKEPTLVRKDIRGFITNRLMYAMYREACFLVEQGYASMEDVDRACRNNAGYWMTLLGVFRWMDLTGVGAYHAVMQDLLPTLCNETAVPRLIDEVVRTGGKGMSNGKGFYPYTAEEARIWQEVFRDFSYEIRRLALRYPEDVVAKRLEAEKGKVGADTGMDG